MRGSDNNITFSLSFRLSNQGDLNGDVFKKKCEGIEKVRPVNTKQLG